MRLWHITHLIIQLIISIIGSYSYKNHQNICAPLKNNYNFSISANLDTENEDLASDHPFFSGNTIHPSIKSIISSLKDSVLPRYDENKEQYPIVLLAVSGGVDSMSMLHSFYEIFKNSDIISQAENNDHNETKERLERMYNNTFVVHFNHKLRSNSEKDWEFVKGICKSLHFPFIGVESENDFSDSNINSIDYIDENVSFLKFKTQNQSRLWRNGKFSEIISNLYNKTDVAGVELILPDAPLAFENKLISNVLSTSQIKALEKVLTINTTNHQTHNKIGYIFTAHTMDDSVETIIFKLFRGVHIKNIRGIRPFERLDVNNDIALVRPFVGDYKKSLVNFMKARNLMWRDDESNSHVYYRRNIIRNDLIPILSKMVENNSTKRLKEQVNNGTFVYEKGFLPEQIANRMNNLSNQSEMINDMIESECTRFENYIKRRPILIKKNPNFKQIAADSRQESYNSLMDSLSNRKVQFDKHDDYLRLKRIVEHMKIFGIQMPDCFPVSEWSLIEHDIVKMTVLKRWIEANTRDVVVDFKFLTRLCNFINSEYNNTLRYFVLNNEYAIWHQGMFMRIVNKIEKDIDLNDQTEFTIGEGTKVYSDGVVNFYSHDSLNVMIDQEGIQTLCVKLSVPVIENTIHDFDIRMARPSDIMVSHQMWGKCISGLLGKMNIPCLLKDSIPVIALRKSNKILGIYGLKLLPPYHTKSDVSLDYDLLSLNGSNDVNSNNLKTYRIYINNCEK